MICFKMQGKLPRVVIFKSSTFLLALPAKESIFENFICCCSCLCHGELTISFSSGCDVIINKDKGVSRIHAEIVVDEMTSSNPMESKHRWSSRIRVRDFSKYGTFINKNLGSMEKVHEFPNKETTLKDGDLVSFGTGNATYR